MSPGSTLRAGERGTEGVITREFPIATYIEPGGEKESATKSHPISISSANIGRGIEKMRIDLWIERIFPHDNSSIRSIDGKSFFGLIELSIFILVTCRRRLVIVNNHLEKIKDYWNMAKGYHNSVTATLFTGN